MMETPTKAVYSSTNIISRIEELKRWQYEQQKRLVTQQKKQRELLSTEQRRMCEAFGLDVTSSSQDSLNQIDNNYSQNETSFDSTSSIQKRPVKKMNLDTDYSDYESDDQSTLTPQNKRKSKVNFDEIPITTPKKDFVELLESSLVKDTVKAPNVEVKQKRPFLKRGQGLARFRMTQEDLEKMRSKVKEKNSAPNKSSVKQCTVNNNKKLIGNSKNNKIRNRSQSLESSGKENKLIENRRSVNSHYNEVNIFPITTTNFKKPFNVREKLNLPPIQPAPTWSNVFSEPIHETRSHLCAIDQNTGRITSPTYNEVKNKLNEQSLHLPDSVVSDTDISTYEKIITEFRKEIEQKNAEVTEFETTLQSDIDLSTCERIINECRAKKDKEELQIFEILEEKAANSSFCSTSSAIQHLMEQSVKSTPKLDRFLKVKDKKLSEINDNEKQRNKNVHFNCEQFKSVIVLPEEKNEDPPWSDNFSSTSEETELDSTLQDASIQKEPEVSNKHESFNNEQDVIFKSDLLKSRLQELENEIEIFRCENVKLAKQKEDFEKEKKMFIKNKLQTEKQLAEEKVKADFYLNEEKKKLAKEKMVFEKYSKEVKNQPSKKEREEISVLKQKIEELKEEIKLKDSRFGASQARLRTLNKSLEKDIMNVKAEMEKLKKENRRLQSAQRRSGGFSNTKMLHEINKSLSKILPTEMKPNQTKNVNKTITLQSKQTKSNVSKNVKQNTVVVSDSESLTFSSESEDEEKEEDIVDKSVNKTHTIEKSSQHSYFPDSVSLNDNVGENTPENKPISLNISKQIEAEYEKIFGTKKNIADDNEEVNVSQNSMENGFRKGEKLEKVLPDGRKEIWYANGNVKKISPDEKIIKLIYYNGDVKETQLETGTVKYYYSETKTWHTTYIDGLEILEFSNGQTEKRFKDGTIEVTFPNNSTKVVDKEGNEKWIFMDGTKVSINKMGEKIIDLPNGQREIHINDHKRREYPDGTVKILYPDGVTETRYSRGRIRIRDKEGNIIMDSGDSGDNKPNYI